MVASFAEDGSPARLVIADDHSVVRAGLRLLLEGSGWEVVGEAADVVETREQVAALEPDVLLLDLHMPGGSTHDVIRRAAASKRPRVLVLSADEHAVSVRAALRAGASGYVAKDAGPRELLEAVRRVADGQEYVSPGLGATLVGPRADRLAAIPEEDLAVLRLIALGHTSKEIADILETSQRQVEWRRKRTQRALGARTRPDLVRIALEEGLVDGVGY